MPYTGRDGYRIFYEMEGADDAPILILSHSLGANRTMWDAQHETFSRHFRVLRYDHPGHGHSDKRPSAGTIDDMGRDVLALMDTLSIETCSFCGLSLGGMVGMWLGINAGERLDRLVLCNTTARIEDPSLLHARLECIRSNGLASISDSVINAWFTPAFRRSHPATVQQATRMFLTTTSSGYVQATEVVCALDMRGGLGRISIPTRVLYGRCDAATPPSWNEAVAGAIAGATAESLDTAHLSNVEAPERFGQCASAFLRADNSV